jgi:hypothetical protein
MERPRVDPPGKVLCRRWVHSHEEDVQGEMVFRPADFAFPLSRGRFGFQLRKDGSAVTSEPGPTDRPRGRKGSWRLEHGDLRLETPAPEARVRTFEIVSVTPEQLVVRRK